MNLRNFELLQDTSSDVRLAAFAKIATHLARVNTLDAVTRSNFERMGRQLAGFRDWSEAEHKRFSHLTASVRTAFATQASANLLARTMRQ